MGKTINIKKINFTNLLEIIADWFSMFNWFYLFDLCKLNIFN